MKAFLPAALILLTIACGGVKPVQIDFHLPVLQSGDSSDNYFRQGWEQLQKGDSDAAYKSFQLSEVRLDRSRRLSATFSWPARDSAPRPPSSPRHWQRTRIISKPAWEWP